MTNAQHTPGPWNIEVFTRLILIESDSGCVCEIPSDHDPERRIANGRL